MTTSLNKPKRRVVLLRTARVRRWRFKLLRKRTRRRAWFKLRAISPMIRRFALAPVLFLALWTLWFILPPTREAARKTWQARLGWAPNPASQSSDSRDDSVARTTAISGLRKRADAFARLSQRFPDDATIAAQELVLRSGGLLPGVRQPGPSSSLDPNWSVKMVKVKTPSATLLCSWFATTARGQKLEPQNTFWDWMHIIGLLAARRNGEVWPVLRAASSKTSFDDHVNDVLLATLRARRRQNNPMSPISQVDVSGASMPFGTEWDLYGPVLEAVRQLSDDASGLRIQGGDLNKKATLEGMRDLVFLCRTLNRQAKTSGVLLVAQEAERTALYGGTYSPRMPTGAAKSPPRVGASVSVYASDVRSLLRLARAMKRRDVAAQLASEWLALGVWHKKTSRFIYSGSVLEGVEGRDLGAASLGDLLGSILVAGMPSLLVLATSCALTLHLAAPWRRPSQEVFLSRGSWWGGAAIGLFCVPLLVSATVWSFHRAGVTWRATASDLVFVLSQKAHSEDAGLAAPTPWREHLPAIALLVCAFWCAAAWQAHKSGRPFLVSRLRRVFETPDDGFARFDVAPLLSATGVLAAVFVATVGVAEFLALPAIDPSYNSSVHDCAALALAVTAFLLALPALWHLRDASSRAFALKLAGRFAWAFLFVATLLWGVLTLATAPAHRRFELQLDCTLQVGEFQLARKRLGI